MNKTILMLRKFNERIIEVPQPPKTEVEAFIFCEFCNSPMKPSGKVDWQRECGRCTHKIEKFKNKSPFLACMLAFSALMLFIPANLMPFMVFEMSGQKTESTIWQGIVSLFNSGDKLIAVVIFIASLLIPFLKIFLLFFISTPSQTDSVRTLKSKIFIFLEKISPWSMLDIFLVAIFIAVVKLGAIASVAAGPGAIAFLSVVVLSMFAAALFETNSLIDLRITFNSLETDSDLLSTTLSSN